MNIENNCNIVRTDLMLYYPHGEQQQDVWTHKTAKFFAH